jgi:LPXTG-motif cell wall-anchored protein
MGRRVLLAAVLSAVLATVSVSPALAQLDLSGNAPPPPEYQVKDDGSLVIGGDVVVSCFQIGQEDPYLQADGPEARACEAAGFGTAAGPSSGGASTPDASASALPETGGSGGTVAALVPLALLMGGLLAFVVVRGDF